jgi:adenine-specific DNA-methyltransferase
MEQVGRPSGSRIFVDLFCGTGSVAEAAALKGWNVHLNDHLHSAVVMAAARLIGVTDARFHALGGYERAVERLNCVPARKGFIYREYSPASVATIGLERRYFTTFNAGAIDAVRHQIANWDADGLLTEGEKTLLLADLISAANRVANIAGTYGCFLSKWQKQATDAFFLRPRKLNKTDVNVTTSVEDASRVKLGGCDTVYIDPPYTKRQYAAYYHLIETIVLGDEPQVQGVSGLRPWRHKASDFCYKSRALEALVSLVRSIPSDRIFLSYSDSAHVPIHALTERVREIAAVEPLLLKDIGRYRPNRTAIMGNASVGEYLIAVQRAGMEVAA